MFKAIFSRAAAEGNNNTIIQNTGLIQTGLTYKDAKQLALDLFDANLYRLTKEAEKIVKERLKEFTTKVLDEILRENPRGFNQFNDPGIQYALLNAQQEYARNGDASTADILIDLVVQRINQKDRNLEQIIVDEAIKVAGKITSEQMILLTLNLICRLRLSGFDSLESLERFLGNFISHASGALEMDREEARRQFYHLSYAGCVGSKGLASDFQYDLGINYDFGFNQWNEQPEHGFQEIFTSAFIGGSDILNEILSKSENKTFICSQDFKAYGLGCDIDASMLDVAIIRIKDYMYNREKLSVIIETEPYLTLSKAYDTYGLGGSDLTPVGLCIAKSYLRSTLLFNF